MLINLYIVHGFFYATWQNWVVVKKIIWPAYLSGPSQKKKKSLLIPTAEELILYHLTIVSFNFSVVATLRISQKLPFLTSVTTVEIMWKFGM